MLMTIWELWDPNLVGDGALEALEALENSERGTRAMGELNKVQICRGG